ncbi:AMP-binding protein [Spirillospora sp. NPDC052242]
MLSPEMNAEETGTGQDVAARMRSWLDVFDTPEACAAKLLCDRHDPAAVAFTIVESDLGSRDVTYGELADASRRLATTLAERGVGAGDNVAVLMGKRFELVVTLLAIWRLGAVHVPLFTAFATPAIERRVRPAGVRLIVTEPSQRDKIEPLLADGGIGALVAGPELDERRILRRHHVLGHPEVRRHELRRGPDGVPRHEAGPSGRRRLPVTRVVGGRAADRRGPHVGRGRPRRRGPRPLRADRARHGDRAVG